MNETLLSVHDLHVRFDGDAGTTHAVTGVSFELARDEVLGIVGESGSGKSATVMGTIGLLDPNAEVTGSVRLGERELLTLGSAELRRVRGREIAVVFQDPMTALNPVYRIGWQLAEQIQAHSDASDAEAEARAVELLRSVGLPDPERRVRDYPHELSGGMRQRVMIALASPATRASSSPTSRRRRLTSPSRLRSSTSSVDCAPNTARRSCSSPTTWA